MSRCSNEHENTLLTLIHGVKLLRILDQSTFKISVKIGERLICKNDLVTT